MSGKINGMSGASQPQQVGASNAGQVSRNMSSQGATAGANAASDANSSSADQVDITGTASELATAEQNLSSVPVVNEAKVSTIRGAIEAGTYKIQPQKIANRLIESDKSLPEVDESDSSDAA